MLGIQELKKLNLEFSWKNHIRIPTPKPLGRVVVALFDPMTGIECYLSRTGIVMTDRDQVTGWESFQEAFAFADKRACFFAKPLAVYVTERKSNCVPEYKVLEGELN